MWSAINDDAPKPASATLWFTRAISARAPDTQGLITSGTGDQVLVVADDPTEELGIARLLLEVELRPQMGLELVDERLDLEEPRGTRTGPRPAATRSGAAPSRRRPAPPRRGGGPSRRPRARSRAARRGSARPRPPRAALRRSRRRLGGRRRPRSPAGGPGTDRWDVVDEPSQLVEVGIRQQVGAGAEDSAPTSRKSSRAPPALLGTLEPAPASAPGTHTPPRSRSTRTTWAQRATRVTSRARLRRLAPTPILDGLPAAACAETGRAC
jgi:hypothetical protein